MLLLGLGCVAQLVEHLTFNQRVLGSNPSAATTHFKFRRQLVSRNIVDAVRIVYSPLNCPVVIAHPAFPRR